MHFCKKEKNISKCEPTRKRNFIEVIINTAVYGTIIKVFAGDISKKPNQRVHSIDPDTKVNPRTDVTAPEATIIIKFCR